MSNLKSLFTEAFNSTITRPEQVKLSATVTALEDLEEPLKSSLEEGYSGKKLNAKIFAALINAAVTQSKVTFLFSRNILQDILASDSNLKRNTVDGNEFKEFMGWVRGSGYLTELVRGEGLKSASVFEFSYAPVIEIIAKNVSKAFLEVQKENCLKIHKTSIKTSKETSTELMSNEVMSTAVLSNDSNVKVLDKENKNTETKQSCSPSPNGEASPKDESKANPTVPQPPLLSAITQEMLEAMLSYPRLTAFEQEFLKAAPMNLKKYGRFTEKQLGVLEKIKLKQPKPALTQSIFDELLASCAPPELITKVRQYDYFKQTKGMAISLLASKRTTDEKKLIANALGLNPPPKKTGLQEYAQDDSDAIV